MSESITQSTTQASGGVTDEARSAAKDVAGTAREQARHVGHEARDQAQHLWNQSRDELVHQASQQQSRLAGGLRDLGTQLQSMADGAQESGTATGLVREAAGHVQKAAGWFESREPGDVVQQVRAFARQRPGAFLAGAALLGVVAGRMTRATVDENRGGGQDGSSGPAAAAAPVPVSDYPGHGTTTSSRPAATTDPSLSGDGLGEPSLATGTAGTSTSTEHGGHGAMDPSGATMASPLRHNAPVAGASQPLADGEQR